MKLQLTTKQNIWFCSDPHYNHKQIVRGTSTWPDSSMLRPFDTLEEHDNYLVSQINKYVKEGDVLFMLGDVAFGEYKNNANISNVRIFMGRINCKNVHLILGNHDTHIRDNNDNLQDLFVSAHHKTEIVVIDYPSKERGVKPKKQKITLCHYAFRVWNDCSHGSWMLYGHSHNNLNDEYYDGHLTMDIGFDAHPEFRPYAFTEIQTIFTNRSSILNVDHH